jgi:hypothetical protein
VTAPRTPGSSELVRLVAGREISTRIRDKTFLISSGVILLVVLGAMVFQAVAASGANNVTVAVVGDASTLEPALVAQGHVVGADVTVRTRPTRPRRVGPWRPGTSMAHSSRARAARRGCWWSTAPTAR